MSLSSAQFNENLPAFFILLRENLSGFVRGLCRRTYLDPALGDELHIYATAYIQDALLVTFTIRYDKFYGVPVFYFNVSEGLEELAPVQDLDYLVRKYAGVISLDAVGAVSLETNPVTNMVSFFIHPCETSATLADWDDFPAGGESRALRYLTVWFNLYGLSRVFHAAMFRPVR